jgi:hypothetical protein
MLLRDRLVEVITCVRSHAALVESVAYAGDGPFTEAGGAAAESEPRREDRRGRRP